MTNELLSKALANLKPHQARSAPMVAVLNPHTHEYTLHEVIGMGNREKMVLAMEKGARDVPNEVLVLLTTPIV